MKRHPMNMLRCRNTFEGWLRKLDWWEYCKLRRPTIKLRSRNSGQFMKSLRELNKRRLHDEAMLKLQRYAMEYLKR